jgi:hypothetical protein
MFLMCLIAALSGTPLRQVEAANDFARWLADLADDHGIETVDGGVGDDSGDTILKIGCDPDSLGAMTPLKTAAGFLSPHLPPSRGPTAGHRCPPDSVATLPTGSFRQHVWFQCFLF